MFVPQRIVYFEIHIKVCLRMYWHVKIETRLFRSRESLRPCLALSNKVTYLVVNKKAKKAEAKAKLTIHISKVIKG